jgi:RNA polymerase sigma-70 factor (ECF subfamily)
MIDVPSAPPVDATPIGSAVPSDDAALAGQVAAGDRAAFAALMRRHNRRLYRLARAALRDDAEAEDCLQESYVRAYRSIGGFRAESSLATWLSRLVLNQCLDHLRKSARRHDLAPVVSGDDAVLASAFADDLDRPEQALGRSQLRRLLERKVDALPDEYRAVFVMRSVEELSVEETAESLGIPPATVRSRHFRARGLLREWLKQVDIAERDLFDFGGSTCDRIVATVTQRLRTSPNAG